MWIRREVPRVRRDSWSWWTRSRVRRKAEVTLSLMGKGQGRAFSRRGEGCLIRRKELRLTPRLCHYKSLLSVCRVASRSSPKPLDCSGRLVLSKMPIKDHPCTPPLRTDYGLPSDQQSGSITGHVDSHSLGWLDFKFDTGSRPVSSSVWFEDDGTLPRRRKGSIYQDLARNELRSLMAR